jgi:hypothetical protein
MMSATESTALHPYTNQGEVDKRKRYKTMSWLSKLFAPPDRRKASRHPSPPLLAFYWDGESPKPHAVPDISRNGIFVKTEDRWTASSILRVTLQTQSEDPQKSGETITVQCRVVRAEEDGVGMAILLAEENRSGSPAALGSPATRRQFKKFIEHLAAEMTEKPLPDPPHLPFPEPVQMTAPASYGDQAAEQDPKDNK